MSSITYEELLREALVDLSEMQEEDAQSVGHKLGAKKAVDYAYFLQHWSAMYLRYVQIARKLEKVHDQLLQPQKRQDSRVLLDSCVGRMLEMKRKIIEYCGEYVNFDEALVDLKLTPDALEIPIPRYFVEERFEELSERRQYVQSLIQHYRTTEADAPVSIALTAEATPSAAAPVKEPPMTLEQAVLVLQCNERGRQGRQTAKFHRTIYEQEMHQHREFEYGSTTGKDQAATRIQKIVLGYLARKQVKGMLKQELEFLGMEPSQSTLSNAQRDRSRKTQVERKMRQANNVAELAQEARDVRARIKMQEGGRSMEEMLDEILLHMANVRLNSAEDVLPAFPTDEEGGSLQLLGRRPMKPEEIADAKRQKEEAEKLAKQATKGKDPRKKADPDEDRPTIGASIFWNSFTDARDRYANVWHKRFQDTYLDRKDFDQRLDKDLLRENVAEGPGGTTAELRRCVDQLVMIEVANLRERMERERGMKKRKNAKKPKAKKPPKVKDPSEGAKLESFINSAVYLNVLQLPNERTRVQDYLGTHNMMETALSEHLRMQAEQSDEVKAKWQTLLNNWNPYVEQSLGMTKDAFEVLYRNYCNQSTWMFEPSAAQVRQSITEYCVLPLGSQVIHDLVPSNNTCLLYGFAKSGKTMLTHAICNEAGANFFNLSPSTFNPGTGSGKIIQMVFRIARALAPSVIYLDEAEKIFSGKGKKKKKGDPVAARAAKMKKDIVNCMKELQPTDRVLVIGNSRCPWEADFKEITGFFRSMICCVHPDYASRMQLWQKLVQRKGTALPSYADYEILSHITNKYASGVIADIIDETLTERRLKRLTQRPLRMEEFLPAVARARPIFRDEYQLMSDFAQRLPMTVRRAMESDFKEEIDPKAKKPAGKPPAKKTT